MCIGTAAQYELVMKRNQVSLFSLFYTGYTYANVCIHYKFASNRDYAKMLLSEIDINLIRFNSIPFDINGVCVREYVCVCVFFMNSVTPIMIIYHEIYDEKTSFYSVYSVNRLLPLKCEMIVCMKCSRNSFREWHTYTLNHARTDTHTPAISISAPNDYHYNSLEALYTMAKPNENTVLFE